LGDLLLVTFKSADVLKYVYGRQPPTTRPLRLPRLLLRCHLRHHAHGRKRLSRFLRPRFLVLVRLPPGSVPHGI